MYLSPFLEFGICASAESTAAAKAAGWEFVEESVQGLLEGLAPDEQWKGMERVKAASLPVAAANCLVPGSLKITGPEAKAQNLRPYMQTVLKRAQEVGIKVLVFGSGGARNVPQGWDREQARRQIIDFAKMSAEMAERHEVVIVAEHLNSKECNIINSVAEAMTYVKAVGHPNFQCLVDSFHFWQENEAMEDLRAAMPWIKHVHLSDRGTRAAPGEGGTSDYRELFRVLKEGRYEGRLSVEAIGFKVAENGAKVLEFLKRQWNSAGEAEPSGVRT